MSLINSHNLLGLSVVTESGKQLGSVRAFDCEVETHTIIRYYVKSGGRISFIGREELIIPVASVVRITAEHMVVEDGVVREPAHTKKILPVPNVSAPVLQRE